MSERFPQLFWGLVVVGVALVIAALAGSAAVRDVKRANDQIMVTGSARRPIRSDFVVWRVSVSSQRDGMAPAYQEVQKFADRARAFLRAQGIADSLITTVALETERLPEISFNGRETGKVLGYRLTQSFDVRSADVEGITRIARAVNDLITEGVPVASRPPQYLYTKLADIRIAMLSEATKDARARAVEVAKAAGSEIGALRRADMGVFQVTPRHSTEISDYGMNDVSSVEKDITAVVHVTFAVER